MSIKPIVCLAALFLGAAAAISYGQEQAAASNPAATSATSQEGAPGAQVPDAGRGTNAAGRGQFGRGQFGRGGSHQ